MSRFHFRIAWLTAAVLLVSVSSSWALDLGGHDRDGTVVGLTIGHGWNSIKFTPEGGSSRDTGNVSAFTGGARVGWASSDYFIASIGLYGWKKNYYTYSYLSTSTSNFNFMLEGYFFPRGEGLWIKGGIGRGTLDFTAKAVLPEDDLVFYERGWTWSTGAGYEFRVSDEAAVGISYDLLYLPISDFEGFSDISHLSQNLSLNIHFYM